MRAGKWIVQTGNLTKLAVFRFGKFDCDSCAKKLEVP